MRNKENQHQSKYRTNRTIRAKIDKLLHKNAQIWSNLGTGTPLDVGTRERGEKKWRKIAEEIKELDEQFYNRIT